MVERQQKERLGQVLSEPRSQGREREYASEELERSRGRWGGPYLLLLPVALAVGSVWYMGQPPHSVVPTGPPARVDPESTHDVLGGEVTLSGASLVFWLAPSKPDPESQAFQSKALRKRYGLPEGELWRLRLEWRDLQGTAPPEPDAVLDLSRLAVEDAMGRALAPLHLGRAMDPLATLLEPPASALVPGRGIDLFLWGRVPGASPRLCGVGPVAEEGPEGTSPCASLKIRPQRSGDLAGPLARLDPVATGGNSRIGGKAVTPRTSTRPVRGSDGARY